MRLLNILETIDLHTWTTEIVFKCILVGSLVSILDILIFQKKPEDAWLLIPIAIFGTIWILRMFVTKAIQALKEEDKKHKPL